MSRPTQPVRRLVLDAQGVVFNAPLFDFLGDMARRTGQSEEALRERWRSQLRIPAWTGGISDEDLWSGLAAGGGAQQNAWHLLEERYEPGPAAVHLARWAARVPVWLLSNHRAHWLMPRLERFGIEGLFERVLVSDRLGVAKPAAAAFAATLEGVAEPGEVLFVDDLERNVRAARANGLTALRADAAGAWIGEVDALLGSAP